MGDSVAGPATVMGAGLLTFGCAGAWMAADAMGAPGWTGAATLATASGLGLSYAVARRAAVNREHRREIEARYRRQRAIVNSYPLELQRAIGILTDEWAAGQFWTNPEIRIGRAPDPRTGFAGEWPQLEPGQDKGHRPDPGFRPSPVGLRLRLRLPEGFNADHVRARLGVIASTLGVINATVVAVAKDSAVVSLELRTGYPLATSVRFDRKAIEPSPVNLKAVKVGMQEDGNPYRMRVAGVHLLIAGLTGSGKSGLLWSLIGALAPDIAADRARIAMIDLKFGSEMGAGDRLFYSFAWEALSALDTLEMMVRIMTERANPRREHARRTAQPMRDFVPKPGDPHWFLIIDEVLDLLKISGELSIKRDVVQLDGTVKTEKMTVAKYAARLLLSLLSRARSFGITVIAATQNAAKEIFELLRDMFSARIALRVAGSEQLAMIVGHGAAERGVDAINIPVDEPGTIFVDSPEAGGQAIRARAFEVTDEDITWLVETFGRLELEALPGPSPETVALTKPTLTLVAEPDEAPDEDEETPLLEQAAAIKKPQCRFCGRELPPRTGGGRPALYCPGTDHRQQYARLKKRMEG